MGTGLSWWLRMKGKDSCASSVPKGEKQESPTHPSTLPCSLRAGQPEQGFANSSLRARSGLPPVSMNKVLLERSHIHLLTCSLWLLSHHRRRPDGLQQRLCDLQSPRYFLSAPLQKMLGDPGIQGILALRQRGWSWGDGNDGLLPRLPRRCCFCGSSGLGPSQPSHCRMSPSLAHEGMMTTIHRTACPFPP